MLDAAAGGLPVPALAQVHPGCGGDVAVRPLPAATHYLEDPVSIATRNLILTAILVVGAVSALALAKDAAEGAKLAGALSLAIGTLWMHSGRGVPDDLDLTAPRRVQREPSRYVGAVVPVLLLLSSPALACLQDNECDTGCCRYTQCQAASVCADEAAPAKRAALPLWPVLLPGIALLAAVAWRTRRRLPLRAMVPACLLLCASCAGLSLARVGAAVIDCSAPALQGQIAGLLQRVSEILLGGQPDWASQLQALEASGVPALACAVSKASSGGGGLGGTGPASADAGAEARERGRLYLAQRGLVVR